MSWVKKAEEKVVYVGIFLDEASQDNLVDWWEKATGKLPLPLIEAEHMTVKFAPTPEEVEAFKKELGRDITLTVTGWNENEGVQAVTVDDAFMAFVPAGTNPPAIPHITIAHRFGVPPKESGTMLAGGINSIIGPALNGKLGFFTSSGIQVEASEEATLYIDLDGVLVDFEKGFQQKTGQSVDEYSKAQPFYKAIQNDQAFWGNLEWLPGGQEFWNSIAQYNPTILTGPLQDDTSRTGKRVWVEKNLGPNVPVILESQKSKYARPGAVLVDDMEKHTNPWNEIGGTAILHSGDYGETLKQVQRAMEGKVTERKDAKMTPEWEELIAAVEYYIKNSPGFSWKILYDAIGGTEEEKEGGTYIEWLLNNIDPGEVRGYLTYEFGGLPGEEK